MLSVHVQVFSCTTDSLLQSVASIRCTVMHYSTMLSVQVLLCTTVRWFSSKRSKYALHYHRYFTAKRSKYSLYCYALQYNAQRTPVQVLFCTTAASMVTPKQLIAILYMLILSPYFQDVITSSIIRFFLKDSTMSSIVIESSHV